MNLLAHCLQGFGDRHERKREGYRGIALFTFAMVMAAILSPSLHGALNSKMAAIAMVKVNNATPL